MVRSTCIRTFVILSDRRKIELRGKLADAKREAVRKCNTAASITIMDRDVWSIAAIWTRGHWA